jgi:hypothetical protein
VAESEDAQGAEFDHRLRASLMLLAPPASSTGVLQDVQRRVARRRRRVREAIGGALVVFVGAGTAAGLALSAGPQLTAVPPGHVRVPRLPATTVPAPSPADVERGSSAGSPEGALSARPPTPAPCPIGQSTPSVASGSFCGPAPGAGNGLGPNGTCTGGEADAPCGPGVVPGRFYTYTVPGTCSGLVTFDGRQWVSELPPPNPVPNFDVWIQLGTDGSVRWIAPTGSVGFRPYEGQALATCRG